MRSPSASGLLHAVGHPLVAEGDHAVEHLVAQRRPPAPAGAASAPASATTRSGRSPRCSPWYSASSSVQIAFIASTRSRMTPKRVRGSVPWSRISSPFQPAPTPNRTRPPERKSSEATSLAVMIGSRWMIRQMPVASLMRSVTAAAAASATNGIVRVAVLARQLPSAWVRGLAAHRDVRVLGQEERLEAALLGQRRERAPARS